MILAACFILMAHISIYCGFVSGRRPPNYFASKTQKISLPYYIFLAACNKKFRRANATDISRRMEMIHQTIG